MRQEVCKRGERKFFLHHRLVTLAYVSAAAAAFDTVIQHRERENTHHYIMGHIPTPSSSINELSTRGHRSSRRVRHCRNRRCRRRSRRRRGLVDALLHVSLEDVPPLELPPAERARVAGRDAALVPLVPDQRGLVEVVAAAAGAGVLVRVGVAVAVGWDGGVLARLAGGAEAGVKKGKDGSLGGWKEKFSYEHLILQKAYLSDVYVLASNPPKKCGCTREKYRENGG